MNNLIIRLARPGEEAQAHIRSIREICIKDHGEEEVRGWETDLLETGGLWP